MEGGQVCGFKGCKRGHSGGQCHLDVLDKQGVPPTVLADIQHMQRWGIFAANGDKTVSPQEWSYTGLHMLPHSGGQISERGINCNLITCYSCGLATNSLDAPPLFILVVLHF